MKLDLRRLQFGRRASVIRDEQLAANPAFVQWLAFGFSFDLHVASEEIERLDGAVRSWRTYDEQAWLRARTQERHDYLDALLSAIVTDSLAAPDTVDPVVVSLSGGYDSRAIAAVWPRERLDAVTYGRPGASDYDMVTLLAASHPMDLRLYPLLDLSWQREPLIAELMTAQDRHLSPRSVVGPLVDAERGPHSLVHGFGNGVRIPPQGRQWSQDVRAFAAESDPFGFQEALGEDVVLAMLPATPWATVLSRPAQLTMGVRHQQRIRPASTATRHMLLPFHDERWQGFWLGARDMGPFDKHVWLTFLAQRHADWFPELADWDGVELPRRHERNWLSEHATPRDAADPGPVKATADHCWRADYRDNRSFRELVDDSLARLRSTQILEDSFLDDQLREWRTGSNRGWRAVRGLVATELSLAGGAFDD